MSGNEMGRVGMRLGEREMSISNKAQPSLRVCWPSLRHQVLIKLLTFTLGAVGVGQAPDVNKIHSVISPIGGKNPNLVAKGLVAFLTAI